MDRQYHGVDGEHWRVKETGKTKSHMDRQHEGMDGDNMKAWTGTT